MNDCQKLLVGHCLQRHIAALNGLRWPTIQPVRDLLDCRQVMRDLRRLPGTGPRQFSPALQLEIRAATERRELALDLAADLDEELPKFTLQAEITEDPEVVGKRIRDTLGVTDELQIDWRDADGRTGFNAWRSRIEQTGTFVFQTTVGGAQKDWASLSRSSFISGAPNIATPNSTA